MALWNDKGADSRKRTKCLIECSDSAIQSVDRDRSHKALIARGVGLVRKDVRAAASLLDSKHTHVCSNIEDDPTNIGNKLGNSVIETINIDLAKGKRFVSFNIS